jgi:outer membrane receptor for ferrienterochelin and colicins
MVFRFLFILSIMHTISFGKTVANQPIELDYELESTVLEFGEISISGKVLDSKSNEPVALVNIRESSSGLGTTTDERGQFTLTAKDRSQMEIDFTHIAYNNYHKNFSVSDTGIVIILEETLLQMNDVVVTSTRSGYFLRDVPIATEVIGKKEIIESGAITISELLAQRAGVSTSVNVDGGSIFNMLGLDSRYILILKDNQPITGRFNNRVDLNQVSTNRIKKIEIIKGPGSAVYGTDAMGGVINIITDDSNEFPSLDLSYRASSFGGTPSEISSEPVNSIVKGSLVLPFKNITLSNDLTYQHFTKGQQFEYISADQIDKLNLNTDLSWKIDEHDIHISHQYFNQKDNGKTRLSSGTVLYTNATTIDRSQFTLTHSWQINDQSSIEQTIRKADYIREYAVTNNNGLEEKDDMSIEDNTEYELLFKRGLKSLTLNGGLEFSRPRYESDRITGGEQDKDIIGVFNQVAWNILPRLDLVSGLRLDKYGDTTVVSPRLAIAHKTSANWTYRAAYGHGFRAPSFMETLIDWEHIQFGYTVKGNPSLKPEVSRGITVGAEYRNKNNFQASALIYHNSFSNLIKDYALESGVLSYRNIEKAYFTGLELITKWTITNAISSSITLNYVKNKDETGKQIPNTMPISIGSRIAYAPGKQKFLFALTLKGIGEYFPQEFDPASGDYISSSDPINAYIMGDFQIIYNIDPEYQIVLGSKNIGNHINRSYGPYIGRTAYIEINTNKKRK